MDSSDFYKHTRFIIQWFNSELSRCMDLYVETDTRSYVLTENYHCNILTTSRIYIDTTSGEKRLLPPYAWNSRFVNWKVAQDKLSYVVNACNMYAFDTFDEFVVYLKLVHAMQDRIPLFSVNPYMREESLTNFIDTDSEPAPPKRYKTQKIYIS